MNLHTHVQMAKDNVFTIGAAFYYTLDHINSEYATLAVLCFLSNYCVVDLFNV